MEAFNSSPEPDSGNEILVEKRERLLGQAFSLLDRAEELEEEQGRAHVIRAPYQIPDMEDVVGVMLTRDGERPFRDEEKEHIMLYFPDFGEDLPVEKKEQTVWIKEYNPTDRECKEYNYVLNRKVFGVRTEDVDEFIEGLLQHAGSSEMGQLNYFSERFERFKITPFKGGND